MRNANSICSSGDQEAPVEGIALQWYSEVYLQCHTLAWQEDPECMTSALVTLCQEQMTDTAGASFPCLSKTLRAWSE